MAILLPDELNKIKDVEFEIDLGFSIFNTLNSYRKDFHVSNYFNFKTEFMFNKEELELFEIFYNETLIYGTENISLDIGIGFDINEYIITDTPVVKFLDNDNYSVSLNLLQKNFEIDVILDQTNRCLQNLIKNLKGENLFNNANVEASEELKNAALCLINLKNLVNEDLNNYIKYYIITDNIIN